MDFRKRLLKENKQSSNSTIDFPKNLQFFTPKSTDFEQAQKVRQLEMRMKDLIESQRAESTHSKQLFSKLEQSVLLLEGRMSSIEKFCITTSNNIHAEQQEIQLPCHQNSLPEHDVTLFRPYAALDPRQLHPSQHQSSTNSQANCKFVTEQHFLKALQSVRTSFEGKSKAFNDRILLDFNIKSQFNARIKQEEERVRLVHDEKKLTEANAKIKSELQHQILRKFARLTDEETEKMARKVESSLHTIKKQLLNEIDKDRSICLEEISKVRVEFDGRVKARDERGDFNLQRESQRRKNQQQQKASLEQAINRIIEGNNRLRNDIMAEINRLRSESNQSSIKIKNEVEKQMVMLRGNIEGVAQHTESQLSKLASQVQQSTKAYTRERAESQQIKLYEQQMKQQVMRQVHIVNDRLQLLYQSIDSKVNAEMINWQEAKSSTFSQHKKLMENISKLQVDLFAQKQQNKAVYQKMGSDILDIIDSLTVMMSELKPYRQ